LALNDHLFPLQIFENPGNALAEKKLKIKKKVGVKKPWAIITTVHSMFNQAMYTSEQVQGTMVDDILKQLSLLATDDEYHHYRKNCESITADT